MAARVRNEIGGEFLEDVSPGIFQTSPGMVRRTALENLAVAALGEKYESRLAALLAANQASIFSTIELKAWFGQRLFLEVMSDLSGINA